nr:MAG TPA: hypothetical protein [Bacteriophage sp.]
MIKLALSWLLVLIGSPSTTQRYYTELCGRGYMLFCSW